MDETNTTPNLFSESTEVILEHLNMTPSETAAEIARQQETRQIENSMFGLGQTCIVTKSKSANEIFPLRFIDPADIISAEEDFKDLA